MSDYEIKTWMEFRDSGLLWFVNRILHVFGWVLVVKVDTDEETGVVSISADPARTVVLGFPEETDERRRGNVVAFIKDDPFIAAFYEAAVKRSAEEEK